MNDGRRSTRLKEARRRNTWYQRTRSKGSSAEEAKKRYKQGVLVKCKFWNSPGACRCVKRLQNTDKAFFHGTSGCPSRAARYETLECQFCYGRVADGTEERLEGVTSGVRRVERNAATKRMRVPGVLGVRRVVDIASPKRSCLRWRSSKKKNKRKVRFCHKKRLLDTHGAHTMRVFLRKVASCVIVAFTLCVAVAEGVTFERLKVA